MEKFDFALLMKAFTAIRYYGTEKNFQAIGFGDRSSEVWYFAQKYGLPSAYDAKMAAWEKKAFESLISELLKIGDYSKMAHFLEEQSSKQK